MTHEITTAMIDAGARALYETDQWMTWRNGERIPLKWEELDNDDHQNYTGPARAVLTAALSEDTK